MGRSGSDPDELTLWCFYPLRSSAAPTDDGTIVPNRAIVEVAHG